MNKAISAKDCIRTGESVDQEIELLKANSTIRAAERGLVERYKLSNDIGS